VTLARLTRSGHCPEQAEDVRGGWNFAHPVPCRNDLVEDEADFKSSNDAVLP
jgi:hypothetical protein